VVGLGDSEDNILSFIAAGVAGYVLKESSVDEMIEHVRTVAGGSARISPSIARALMDRVADLVRLCDEVGISVGGVANLTPREAEVLELISRGFTNQEIADEMVIELGTVKNHVHNVLRKLNVSNRTDAARYFMLMKGGEAAAAP
jgi:DNA-binding NarL/FixJ family response regulator